MLWLWCIIPSPTTSNINVSSNPECFPIQSQCHRRNETNRRLSGVGTQQIDSPWTIQGNGWSSLCWWRIARKSRNDWTILDRLWLSRTINANYHVSNGIGTECGLRPRSRLSIAISMMQLLRCPTIGPTNDGFSKTQGCLFRSRQGCPRNYPRGSI